MFRPCILIPTYNNPMTLKSVVEGVRRYVAEVIVVDDGSGPEGVAAAEQLKQEGLATVLFRPNNGGKGAAVKTGFREAAELGFSHALQIDADAQHDLGDVPRFLSAAKSNPGSAVFGCPVFDETVPKSRLHARKISIFWANLETLGPRIKDPLCGFRCYPLPLSATLPVRGNYMDFDPEIAVHLIWAGTPIINLPTRVHYIPESEGGVSSFRLFRDNFRISVMHSRLVMTLMLRLLLGWRIPG